MTVLDMGRHDPGRLAISVAGAALDYRALEAAAGAVAVRVAGAARVAVVAEPSVELVVAIVGVLAAGAAVVPLNPGSGNREREHVLGDSTPDLTLAPGDVDLTAAAPLPAPPDPSAAALIVYTSGTTGLPKGVVLSHRAVAANIDAIAEAWAWSSADRVAHALPLFHVHGLVLGTLAPLRLGGASVHCGRFDPTTIGAAVAAGATMVFGVPTMWSRLADAAASDPALARTLAGARLLVSGSAALPLSLHERIGTLLGRRVLERYGMTETLFSTAERANDAAPPGSVGRPLALTELRIVDDGGAPVAALDDATIGDVEVRGAGLFDGYLNQPEATAASFTDDGWFRTGDIGAQRPDGSLRLVGRRATDLIKSGGFRIGAGEIETVLLDHPAIVEVAVTGEPDDELGQRIVAWVVVRPGWSIDAAAVVDHVARELTAHKRPRDVRFLAALPRNAMGKVVKRDLADSPTEPSGGSW